jgi:SAM-dependent methyltransferase
VEHSRVYDEPAYSAWQREIGDLTGRFEGPRIARWIAPTDTVVDFGCGTGSLLLCRDAKRKIGVEPAIDSRRIAEGRGLEVVAHAKDLPAAAADVVVSTHALEHTLDPYRELVALHAALKPNGKLVLVVPLEDWRAERRGEISHHLYAWTPRTLRNLVAEAGFTVESARREQRGWPPGYAKLTRVPARMFDALCWVTAVALRRRQIVVVARKPGRGEVPLRSASAASAT